MTNHNANAVSTTKNRPKIGLALSGGGVRGLAHLGVLRTLEEADIPVDIITGTSMGALIGSIYAAGVPLDDMIAFASHLRLLDLASPDRNWRGFFDQRKLSELLTDMLGSDRITFEELKIPVAVVATDLVTGELVILNSGPLIPALQATTALPVFFAPVHHDGRWLVDGGVLNNVPFDLARHMHADRVLAVTFPRIQQFDLETKAPQKDRGPSIQMLKQLRSLSEEWRQPFFIAEATIGMLQELINDIRTDLSPPDVMLRVSMPKVGILSIEAGKEAIAAGYRTAQQHLDELESLTTPLPAPWISKGRELKRRLNLAWRILRSGETPLYPPLP